LAEGQTITEKRMAKDAIPRSNTEEGRRILKDASTGAPVFKTISDLLGAVASLKI